MSDSMDEKSSKKINFENYEEYKKWLDSETVKNGWYEIDELFPSPIFIYQLPENKIELRLRNFVNIGSSVKEGMVLTAKADETVVLGLGFLVVENEGEKREIDVKLVGRDISVLKYRTAVKIMEMVKEATSKVDNYKVEMVFIRPSQIEPKTPNLYELFIILKER